MNKKLISLGLTAIIIGIILFWLMARKPETIPIGVNIAQSGVGGYHTAVVEGIQIATKEVNSQGGINGRKIELVIHDNQSTTSEAIRIFKKLESDTQPLMHVTTFSNIANVVGKLAEETKVPHLALVTSAPEITLDKNWVFRLYATAVQENDAATMVLRKLSQGNKLNVVFLDDPYGMGVAEDLKTRTNTVEKYKMTYTPFSRAFNNAEDFLNDALKYDGLYIIGYSSHLEKAQVYLEKIHYQGFIIYCSGYLPFGLTAGPLSGNTYFPASAIFNEKFEYARRFKAKYEAVTGKPFSQHAAVGYDAIHLFAELMRDQPVTRENIRTQFEKESIFMGVNGKINNSGHTHDFTFDFHPARLENGKLRFLWHQ